MTTFLSDLFCKMEQVSNMDKLARNPSLNRLREKYNNFIMIKGHIDKIAPNDILLYPWILLIIYS